jgi:hypothetical protein
LLESRVLRELRRSDSSILSIFHLSRAREGLPETDHRRVDCNPNPRSATSDE